MFKVKSMQRFFSLGLIAILILVYLIMAYFTYTNKKEELNYYAKTAVETAINGTVVQIKASEIAYEFIASRYEKEMRSTLLNFSKEVALVSEDYDKINLEKIKSSGPNYYDYYIINSDNVIINSTFKTVLGLDFKKWPEFSSALDKVRKNGKLDISTITTERKTGKLRKWAYLPIKDGKYILEIGLSDVELQKYSKPIDFQKLKERIIKSSDLIKDIDIYDQHHVNIITGVELKDPKIKADLNKVYQTHQAMDFYDEKDFLVKKYLFFHGLGQDKALNDGNRLLIVKYDNTKINKLLNDLQHNAVLMFLLLIITLVVSVNFFLNKYVVKPIMHLKNSVEKLSKNLLNNEVEEYKIDDTKGPKEINSLAKSFNAMGDNLEHTLVSKRYLNNIINSINDSVIITDKNLVIVDVNIYAEKIINKKRNDIIGRTVTEFFTQKEKIKQVILEFKAENNKEKVKELEIELLAKEGLIPIIANLSAYYDKTGQLLGFIISAKDLTKIQSLINLMQKKADKLFVEAQHDSLTGCLNRRGGSKIAGEVFSEAKKTKLGFSVIMFDLDDFKKVNDTFGHSEGDLILKRFVNIIRENSRKDDIVVRFGGEEFFLLLPKTPINEALTVARRIKESVAKKLSLRENYQITVSGGASEFNGDDQEFKDALTRADGFLYEAKRNGKNRINY